jgi:hypothetical protein
MGIFVARALHGDVVTRGWGEAGHGSRAHYATVGRGRAGHPAERRNRVGDHRARRAGFGTNGALLANVVNGGVNVIMTIIAIRLLDRVGRQTLLLAGTTGMTVGMFLTIENAIGGMGVFLLFGSLTVVALLYFWRKVPETKGRSLQELEQELTGRAVG